MVDLIFTTYFLQTATNIPLQSTIQSSSREAGHINALDYSFLIAAVAMLLLVTGLTAWVVIRFRHKKQPVPFSKSLSPKWEVVILGIPLLLVVFYFILSQRTVNKVMPEDGSPADVIITGHQWWWQANYPRAGVITANEIHLPAGKKIHMELLSGDVIHSWWVPAFGNKMDLVPGKENSLTVNIKEPGIYYGICSEFCGDQHAHMRITVIAQTEEEFNKWLSFHQQPAFANKAFSKGAVLFNEKTCSNCHRIAGTSAEGDTGPDLTHLASRKTLLSGILVNNYKNLRAWVHDPQQLKPGCYMPDFALPDSSLTAITNYLTSLQ